MIREGGKCGPELRRAGRRVGQGPPVSGSAKPALGTLRHANSGGHTLFRSRMARPRAYSLYPEPRLLSRRATVCRTRCIEGYPDKRLRLPLRPAAPPNRGCAHFSSPAAGLMDSPLESLIYRERVLAPHMEIKRRNSSYCCCLPGSSLGTSLSSARNSSTTRKTNYRDFKSPGPNRTCLPCCFPITYYLESL